MNARTGVFLWRNKNKTNKLLTRLITKNREIQDKTQSSLWSKDREGAEIRARGHILELTVVLGIRKSKRVSCVTSLARSIPAWQINLQYGKTQDSGQRFWSKVRIQKSVSPCGQTENKKTESGHLPYPHRAHLLHTHPSVSAVPKRNYYSQCQVKEQNIDSLEKWEKRFWKAGTECS